MSDDEQEYEYDLAVSFAGEERDYATAVVRGLEDDFRVFLDSDNKAELLGQNLVDYFTDLYQHKARFAAIFVSRAYAAKMWTNLERQSVMARASQQRTAYMLPIRMDDTQLPGLLPTIGYADSRIEGLDGIINILREKLGGEHVSATYSGRVPETQADVDLLLALRPNFWEYWLYAGALRIGLASLEDKYRDYEMGYAPVTGETYRDRDAWAFLRDSTDVAAALADRFNKVMDHDVQVRAFGERGTPGDAERIMHMARRLLDVYEGFIDEAARLRGASVPEEFQDAQEAAALFGANPIEEIRTFVAQAVDTMGGLPELVAEHTGNEPLNLTLDITLSIDEAVTDRFLKGLERGLHSL